jgi:hypothetical protein
MNLSVLDCATLRHEKTLSYEKAEIQIKHLNEKSLIYLKLKEGDVASGVYEWPTPTKILFKMMWPYYDHAYTGIFQALFQSAME